MGNLSHHYSKTNIAQNKFSVISLEKVILTKK